MRTKLIVALDYPTWSEAEALVQKLPEVKIFKVGLELYLASQGQAVSELKKRGKEVFLDLKFHDIPHTVKQAACQAAAQGVLMFNVHAWGGREMMKEAVQAAQAQDTLVLAVTVLTSINEAALQELGLKNIQKTVANLASLAQEIGLDGVVASPQEIALIRKTCDPDFKIVCPGIRPHWAAINDQKRIMTPKEALKLGADYLVIGRPITKAADPRRAALRIIKEMEENE